MTAAVDLASKTTPMTLELATAVMRHAVQRLAVLGLGWWQVANIEAEQLAQIGRDVLVEPGGRDVRITGGPIPDEFERQLGRC